MSGDSENPNHDFVCQSNPRGDCVIPPSRPDAKVLSAVYFYYHPATIETKYTGSIQIGFFDGSPASHVLRPNVTVKPRESVGNQSVVGIVSSKPGAYTIAIDVAATPTGSGAKKDIREQVQVVVR